MVLKTEFESAAERVKNLSRVSNDDLAALYGAYKQSLFGDCTLNKPSMFQLKQKKKWEAWMKCKGMTANQAMQLYIDIVKRLEA